MVEGTIRMRSSRIYRNNTLLLQVLVALASLFSVSGFVIECPRRRTFTAELTKLQSGPFSNTNEDQNNVDLKSNFNPFEYSKNTGKSNASYSMNQFSLRKVRMQEIVNKLLDSSDQPETMQSILQQNKEFLLEPLEDDDAVLEPDSIYRAGMGRNERYQTYEESMKERMEKARNEAAKNVLSALMEFVIAFK